MSKIIFWLVVVFLVLLVVRLYNSHQLRKRDAERRTRDARRTPLAEPMVRCERCGVFLPKSEARREVAGFVCSPACDARRPS